MPAPDQTTILLIDDDPSHLKLYSWVVDRGGYRTLTALVKGNSVTLPRDEQVDLSVLDYRIGTAITAVEVARQLTAAFPQKPILVLSDLPWMPDDIAPYAAAFVRKGEPEQMLQTIEKLTAASG